MLAVGAIQTVSHYKLLEIRIPCPAKLAVVHGLFTPLIQLVTPVSPVWIVQTISSYQQIQVRLFDAAIFTIIELHDASMNKFSSGNTVNSHRKFPKNSLVFEGNLSNRLTELF